MKKYLYLSLVLNLLATSAFCQLFPDRHTTSPSDGWKSCTVASSPNADLNDGHWVMFDFQSVYQISTLKLWNLNDPNNLNEGVNQIRVDYSLDANTWTEGGVYNVDQSQGSAFYEGQEVGNLNGASMRYVLITALSNYGGTCYGFDEARFYIGGAVPVELAYFRGTCESNKRLFEFGFAEVDDFDRAEIQHSVDGQEWTTFSTTKILPEKNIQGIYACSVNNSDQRYKNGYFRLKIYDIDRDYTYSDIIKVDCSLDEHSIQIYPNPVRNNMSIDFDLGEDELIEYTIQSIIGEILQAGTIDGTAGANRISVTTESLPSGTFVVQLKAGTTVHEKKFLKIE